MQYVIVPLILVVGLGLVWSWWTSRVDRDPAASVHSFHRALDAMQSGTRPAAAAEAGPDGGESTESR